jgi:hypothetical protein
MHLVESRFFLALLFPLGALLTAGARGPNPPEAFLVSLVTALTFMLFLAGVRELSEKTLMPILVAVVLIIAYPMKSYFLATTSWNVEGLGALAFVLTWAPLLSRRTLFEAYTLGSLSLIVFFVISALLMAASGKRRLRLEWMATVSRGRMIVYLWILLGCTIGLLTALNLLALKLGILRMGLEFKRLPWRLGGIIAFSRDYLSSFSLLLVLYLALRLKTRRLVRATVTAFVYTGLLTGIVSASRGSIVLVLVPPLLLALMLGRAGRHPVLKPRHLGLAAAFVLMLALLHPLVTTFRAETTEQGVGDIAALRSAATLVAERMGKDPLGMIGGVIGTIAARVIGVEEVIILREAVGIPDREDSWHDIVERGRPMPAYYTREVLGIDTYDYQLTPGLVGSLWMLGGVPMVIGGTACFTLSAFGIIGICRARVLKVSSPVAVLASAPGLAILASEATFQQAFSIERLLFILVAITTTELLGRFIICRSRIRPASGTST